VCRCAIWVPGVNGLTAIPPDTKPMISGSRNRHANRPPARAATKMCVRSRKTAVVCFHA
jgi:hypothetical protein